METEIQREILDAFQKIKEKDYSSAQILLTTGLEEAEKTGGAEQQALFHSALGVLCRARDEKREAWRHYEKAEKLIPDDPSLKIISAKFLMDSFSQFDQAIRKMKKVLEIAKGSPSFEHQARALMALAYLKKGERDKARESFKAVMEGDFLTLASAMNVNLDVIEGFVARNFELELCRQYLEKGLALAKVRKEEKSIELFSRLLEKFREEFNPASLTEM